MRYCIFSDVHGNLEALKAFFEHAESREQLKYIFLGDIVGYGPNPNECVELLRNRTEHIIMGNHDEATFEENVDIESFNPFARKVILWTRRALKQEHREFLRSLQYEIVHNGIRFVHATPFQPDRWHYIFTSEDAEINFRSFTEQVCFVGHSHQPIIILQDPAGEVDSLDPQTYRLEPNHQYIINDGSIGQPRDGSPKACYIIYDSETRKVEFHRVAYDFTITQQKMKDEGIPEYLCKRLQYGR